MPDTRVRTARVLELPRLALLPLQRATDGLCERRHGAQGRARLAHRARWAAPGCDWAGAREWSVTAQSTGKPVGI